MVRRLKTTRSGAYRFPRYLEDQDFYCYSTESKEHNGVSEEGSGANSASEQASPPASVIELSDGELEEEVAENQEQGGDPDDHLTLRTQTQRMEMLMINQRLRSGMWSFVTMMEGMHAFCPS
jgi:hypothetical protein